MTTIRAGVAADAAALAELAAATFPLACPPASSAASQAAFIAENLSAERFGEYLADPARRVMVAADGPRLVGYTLLNFGEPTDPDVAAAVTARPAAELSKCYVLPERHGGDVAAALMVASIEVATLGGHRAVWLGVNEENQRAQRFYAKHGFVPVGRKRFRLGDTWEHDHVLERALEIR